jgi:predicted nucleic acid-binding Zn finger protein
MSSLFTLVREGVDDRSILRRAAMEEYGDRGVKAVEAVFNGNVKRYRDFFVVVGQSGEYIVEDDFCTCPDFAFRGRECWHILAVRIAGLSGRFESYDLWYQDSWGHEAL